MPPVEEENDAAPGVWPRLRNFIAGYMSGVALVLAGHPFDTIKVRLQNEGKSGRFRGPMHCVTDTVGKEGVRGLYKGMGAPLFMTGIVNALLFGTQFTVVQEIARRRIGPESDRMGGQELNRRATTQEVMMAAVLVAPFISLIVTPMEGIKGRLQVQYSSAGNGGKLYNGPLDCFKKVYRNLGLRRGIYRGFSAVCICRMSNYAYFGGYAFFNKEIGEMTGHTDANKKLPPHLSMLAGSLAGFSYWLSCYPFDMVKARMQAAPDVWPPKYASLRGAMKTIYRTEGWRAFFNGFVPCVIRSFPANAASFAGYELTMSALPEKL